MTREEDRKEVCETFVVNRSIMRHFLKKRKKKKRKNDAFGGSLLQSGRLESRSCWARSAGRRWWGCPRWMRARC